MQDHQVAHSTASLTDALADKDASCVYISSTNENHHGQALAAIAAGKQVLCDKPLGLTLSQADEMVVTSGGFLSVRIHHAAHSPENLQGWRVNDASAAGGVIPDIKEHNADVARLLFNFICYHSKNIALLRRHVPYGK